MANANAKYDHQKVEAKWQRFWKRNKTFEASSAGDRPKSYVLDMFPYPSGDGLHVGHPRGYTGSDVVANYYRLKGSNVLRPIGFDAFGLPAENAAIKAGVHPAENTKKNIKRFGDQLRSLGLSYDWSRSINTSEPEYYKWTQWLFALLYKNKLAYQKEAYVNWCPKDKTVLANEQVVGGKCERCGSLVTQKKRKQWFFKISDFAEDLLSGLDKLDWPQSTKELQRNWIGKSEGAEIDFKIVKHKLSVRVFTTRADTLFGATYLVLAPEHPVIKEITARQQSASVEAYIKNAQSKTELDRLSQAKSKTGVFTGAYAINPANGEEIPIWVADYVLSSYGHGAVMAVPAHDERDFEFAKAHKLPITEVVSSPGGKLPYSGHGLLVNSGKFGNTPSAKAAGKITKEVGGKPAVQYRLRDWLVSRQRYWGAPIPVVYGPDNEVIIVDESDLPVRLPKDVDFKPTGESPLIESKSFNRGVDKKYGKGSRRECDTLDTFVCSSWYFLRYCDPHNQSEFAGEESLKRWMPVDLYVGGVEHTNGHVLYARFITKVLHKLGLLNFDEPFPRWRHQGLVLGEGGEKMSKSKGNVVNPDEVVEGYGADALRLYEMFMGPFDQAIPWSTAGLEGVRRFINKVWVLKPSPSAPETDRSLHKLVKKITGDIDAMRFNTAVSAFMEFVNLSQDQGITKQSLAVLAILLAPFAPHLAEELNRKWGKGDSIFNLSWPEFSEELTKDQIVTIAVQVNGTMRGTLEAAVDASEEDVVEVAQKVGGVEPHLTGKKIKKSHYVPGRIINLIVE